MVFDWTVSFGNLLTIAGFGFSGVVFVMMMRADTLVLGHRIGSVEAALNKIAENALTIARLDERMDGLENRVHTLIYRVDDYIKLHNNVGKR